MEVSDTSEIPKVWESKVYLLETWKDVYKNIVEPMTGRPMWIPSICPTTLTAPKCHTQVGSWET